MKKILTYIFIISNLISFAQDKDKTRDFFWGANDEFKSANTTPEKWKNESAVIISKFEYYDYHKFGKSVKYTSAIRKRIKLQDAAAVKDFSEFSFKQKFLFFDVKIVKPDGKEIDIDADKELKGNADFEFRIAIPNLEVGDILDYYIYSIQPFQSEIAYNFEPVETSIGDVYPTMNMKVNFNTENDFFVNFKTYNGAPELKEIPTKDSDEHKYELIAKDIEKNDFPRWFYPLVELPCYKFQVVFARSGKYEDRAAAFLSKKEKTIKTTVSKDDVFEFYNDKFKTNIFMTQIENFLDEKTFDSDEDKIRSVYYYFRYYYYTRYIEELVLRQANIFNPSELYDHADLFINSENDFINHFMSFLKKSKIDYDIVIGTNKYNGPIEDLLIQKNISVLLRVNTAKPMYIEYFTPFSGADQFNFNLENTKAYVLQVSKGKRVVDAESVVLPSSTAMDNVSKIVTDLSMNDDFSALKVKRESSYVGHFKESLQDDKLYFYDYMSEDFAKYGDKPILEKVKNKKKHDQYVKEYDALINKSKEKRKETYNKDISSEFGFDIDDVNFAIKNTGRYGKNVPFVFDEDFTIKNNLIKKAGDNYILEIGKMITAQVEIEKKELTRTNNIYIAYPKTYENEINFEIPAGYSVSGIDKLNKNIVNETGEFASKASVSGNKLTVKTTKMYKNYYEPNSNWNKMILFLDGAYQFTQEKILLKKN